MAERERLQKILSACGAASRRKAEEMILAGRVTINGRKAQLGDSAVFGKDRITLDGEPLTLPEEKVYLALHKPRGFVTTLRDERDRRCVAQLVEDVGTRVYPVGRLDKDSEGLVLMTNDGEFANLVTHPRGRIAKTYRVTVRPGVTEEQLSQMAIGVHLSNGKTAPMKVRVLSQEPGRVVLEMVLYEGKNREIRRICEALGLEVARLKRVAEGPVRLGMLPQGRYRALTKEEVKGLFTEARKASAPGKDPVSRKTPAGKGETR